MSDNPVFFSAAEIRHAEKIAREIKALPEKLDNAWLFGAGAIGRCLAWNFRRRGLRVGGFVDNNPALREGGGMVEDVPVLSPEQYLAAPPKGLLVLALAKGFREVRARCRAAGLADRLLPHYLCRAALGIIPFAQRLSAAEIEHDPRARKALDLWDDDSSRQSYRQLVRFQVLFDDADLPAAEPGHYFSPDRMPRPYLSSVIDAGACDGDTLRDFLAASGGVFDAYRAFEPDPENFRKLQKNAPAGDSRIQLFNLGLDDKPGARRLCGFGSLLSSIGDTGDIEIKVDRLDRLVGDSPVTLVKIDVEGHELHVLAGMAGTIRRCRPALAVSMYHQADHLWSVPLRLREMAPGYVFRIGCHGDLYSEAVCYGMPEENCGKER